ncbi:MAG: hypothetical protein K2J18_08615, partial [Paramuribaculum sp.]|nr:hypothetical protein [Paramuribaculum sp.]
LVVDEPYGGQNAVALDSGIGYDGIDIGGGHGGKRLRVDLTAINIVMFIGAARSHSGNERRNENQKSG